MSSPHRGTLLYLAFALAACGGPQPVATLDWSQPPQPTTAPLVQLARLSVDGTRLLGAGGQAVRLRGVNVCSLEFDREGAIWKLNGASSAVIASLADPARWKANVVRMPVNQQWFLEDEAYAARVEALIDDANAHGLYVLLDDHWEQGKTLDPYQDNILELPTFGSGNTTEAFWLKATSRFANRTNLLYDLINEPHGHGDDETAAAMQELVSAIRRRDAAAVIVVGGMSWAHTVDHYRTHPLTGGNLVYSAHQYLPSDRADGFDQRFGNAAKVVPVLVGEFLADADHLEYAKALVAAAESDGANGWLPWAVGCGFDESDDQQAEPLVFLSSQMRALNP